jgi:hypothetical protein
MDPARSSAWVVVSSYRTPRTSANSSDASVVGRLACDSVTAVLAGLLGVLALDDLDVQETAWGVGATVAIALLLEPASGISSGSIFIAILLAAVAGSCTAVAALRGVRRPPILVAPCGGWVPPLRHLRVDHARRDRVRRTGCCWRRRWRHRLASPRWRTTSRACCAPRARPAHPWRPGRISREATTAFGAQIARRQYARKSHCHSATPCFHMR